MYGCGSRPPPRWRPIRRSPTGGGTDTTNQPGAADPEVRRAGPIRRGSGYSQNPLKNALGEFKEFRQGLLKRFFQRLGMDWDPANGTLNGIPYADYVPGQPGYWLTRAFLYGQANQGLHSGSNSWRTILRRLAVAGWHHSGTGDRVSGSASGAGRDNRFGTSELARRAFQRGGGSQRGCGGERGSRRGPASLLARPRAGAGPGRGSFQRGPGHRAGLDRRGTAGVAAPASAPVSTVSSAGGPPPGPPAPAAQGFFPYAVGGGPGIGFGGHSRGTAGSQRPAPRRPNRIVPPWPRRQRRDDDRAGGGSSRRCSAGTSTSTRILKLRTLRPRRRGTSASDRGAGPLGFAGTATKETGHAAGLTVLAGDAFGGGPTVPLVPRTWDPDAEAPDEL